MNPAQTAAFLRGCFGFSVWLRDSAGNLLGLAGPSGEAYPLSKKNAKSIMWLGDSLTAMSGGDSQPTFTRRKPYYLNLTAAAWTNYLRGPRAAIGCPAGNGTLTFDKVAQTMTWAANGDTAGPAVDVSVGGFIRLESGTAGRELCVSLLKANEPAASGSTTVNVTGTAAVGNSYQFTTAASWNAQNGNPFGENQYWYCMSGNTAAQMVLCMAQWVNVATDLTHIDLGTNDVNTIAAADTCLANMQTIIAARQKLGSVCIVSTLNLNSYDADTATQAKQYYNAKLVALSRAMQFELYDGNPYLCNPVGTLSNPGRADCYNTDTLHLSAKGGFLKAKYALGPVMSRYVPKRWTVVNPIVSYDAVLAPNGNLLTNGRFLGAGAAAGTRMAGEGPTSWSTNCSGGAALTATGKMPQGATPVARTDGQPGAWASWTLNNATGVSGEYFQMYQSAYVSAANYAAGDSLVLSGECRLTVAAGNPGVVGVQISITAVNSGQCLAMYTALPGVANLGDGNGETIYWPFESDPITLQAGATNLQVAINVLMAAGGTAVFDIGQSLVLRKVT